MATTPPLHGLRIIECSALGPAAITSALVDLGADVIKVEPPAGDYIREMTWPIVEGTSLMHLHVNRGKRSLVLDLRTEAGAGILKELAADADVVVEAMRPGSLARRGVGYEELRAINPKIVFCTISGYGMTGPYRDYPSHGVAYDTWAGIVKVATDDDGLHLHSRARLHRHQCRAALRGARHPGRGHPGPGAPARAAAIDLAQSDAAAAMDWYRSESFRAYERPESEVTGNKADNYERRAPGTAGMVEGVRYQVYETKDAQHVLFMASEQAFWKNFCEALDRADLFERWPGSKYADHARGNRELQSELRAIFLTKTAAEWLEFGGRVNTPIAPVNTPKSLFDDPQFADRLPLLLVKPRWAPTRSSRRLHFVGEELPHPAKAPTVGQHTEDVLRSVLGYDDARIAAARSEGAFGTDS